MRIATTPYSRGTSLHLCTDQIVQQDEVAALCRSWHATKPWQATAATVLRQHHRRLRASVSCRCAAIAADGHSALFSTRGKGCDGSMVTASTVVYLSLVDSSACLRASASSSATSTRGCSLRQCRQQLLVQQSACAWVSGQSSFSRPICSTGVSPPSSALLRVIEAVFNPLQDAGHPDSRSNSPGLLAVMPRNLTRSSRGIARVFGLSSTRP